MSRVWINVTSVSMRKVIRRVFCHLMRWSGGIRLWRFLFRNRVMILMIHGVMDEESGAEWTPLVQRLPRQKLDERIGALSRHYEFISLQEAANMIAGRIPIRRNCLVLTFDDGYRNNLTHALPVLRRYDAPATFFVATSHVDGGEPFWFDRIDYALQHSNGDPIEARVFGRTVSFSTTDRSSLRSSYKRLRDWAKGIPYSDKEFLKEMEGLATRLETAAGSSLADVFECDDWSEILTWSEIRTLGEFKVTIGSHTVDHIRLGKVDIGDIREQLSESKRTIERQTNRPCDQLSYPNGDYNDETMELARAIGYTCAVTTEDGANAVGDDVMALRRIAIPDDCGVTELLFRVCGLSDAIFRLKRLLWPVRRNRARRACTSPDGLIPGLERD